jgi:hypothetical protein
MAKNEMSVDEFKKLNRELIQKSATTKGVNLYDIQQVFLIYPHVSALDGTLRGSISRIAVEDSTDGEAKSIIEKEYDTNFYQSYRKQFDLFEIDTFSYAGQTWWTLQPGTATLFPALDPFLREYSGWREKRQRSP